MNLSEQQFAEIGAVVIGRNEGERLKSCLHALLRDISRVVYVDSGSTDGSVELAIGLGVKVVQLDMNIPFTAARARNAGYNALLNDYPEIQYIQFVDGDCEIQPDWIETAYSFLIENKQYAAICGRRRERFPEKTIYNQLCDIEWDTPVGEALACGGDALFRVEALKAVSGYNASLIAGEEPEMCFRMRQLGWKIMRLDAEMTLHDAAMTRFGQWWKRNQRAGHAYAESYHLHGHSQERFRYRECRSILLWGLLLPFFLILFSLLSAVFLWGFLLYPLQILRLTRRYSQTYSLNSAMFYALSNVLGKWPQLVGIWTFYKNRLRGNTSKIIEYK